MPVHIRPFLKLSLAFCFLITLLVLSSGPAYAEWVEIASSETLGGYTIYVDPDTIRRKGNLVTIWTLSDYKVVQGQMGSSWISIKVLDEYDCTEEKFRILASSAYAEPMGTGELVYYDSDPGKWTPVVPDSVGQAMWKAACGKDLIAQCSRNRIGGLPNKL
jgi:hypothetical protein